MITFLRQAIFLVPFLFILPKWFGLDGIWASFAVSDFLAFLFTICAGIRELFLLNKRICNESAKSVENVANL
jgi:Na+-driven multidrug efflux pump